jgi:pilus assembly protein CpaE
MDKIKILIVNDVFVTQGYYSDILSSDEDFQIVGEITNSEIALTKVEQLRPDIVILDLTLAKANEGLITEKITMNFPGVGVIIISQHDKPEYLKKAMLAGARDYLIKPVDSETLITAIKKTYRFEKERVASIESITSSKGKEKYNPPQIITVMGTKGGAGKTTISVNLAVQLAQQTKKKVALVDLDLQFGDVAVFLNMLPKKSIAELVQERSKMDTDLLENYLMPHISGIRILPAPTRPEYAELVTPDHILDILTILRREYDYIVIDTPPYFPETVLSSLDMSTQILAVMSMEVPAIKNMKVALELLATLHQKGKVKLVINRASEDLGVRTQYIEETLGFYASALMPSDGKTVVKSVNRGRPFVLGPPTKVSKVICEMADMVIKDTHHQRDIEKERKSKPFIKKLFG